MTQEQGIMGDGTFTIAARMFAAAILSCASGAAAFAAPPPIDGREVSITARELPIDSFLQDLFGQVGEPVVVSPTVSGRVNGAFEGPADDVLADISTAFNLIPYYDGAVVYIYSGQDLQTQTLTVSPGIAARIQRIAEQLGLPDAANSIRTAGNLVIVNGGPRFLEQINDIAAAEMQTGGVASGPAEAETLAFRVFYLKHAWAQDVTLSFGGERVIIPGVASIVRSLVLGRGDQGVVPALGPTSVAMPLAQSVIDGGAAYQLDARGELPGVAIAPVGASVPGDDGSVRVQADPRLNAVIIRDTEARLPIYDGLIESLDREPQLIEIKATIIDLNIDRLRELGIDWRLSDAEGENAILFGEGTADDLLLGPDRNVTPSARGLAISTVIGDDTFFAARLNALEAEGAANIVSRPQVLTLDNVEAIFDNSQTFFVRVAGEREVDLFDISAGTTLRVTPHVFDEGEEMQIRLLVTIEDGRLTTNSVDEIPILRNSSINTQAIIVEGESLLLGGMTSDSSEERVDKVPLLGDVPLLGAAFRDTVTSSGRVERLFLITPRLVSPRPERLAMGEAIPAPAVPENRTDIGAPPPDAAAWRAAIPADADRRAATLADAPPPSPPGVPEARILSPGSSVSNDN